MSESSENLTADAAVTGAVTSPSSIQENVPRGNGNAGGEAEAVQNETANNNLSGQDSTTTAEGDKGNQKEAIIAILEEWAAWERGLEEEAEKAKVAGDIKEEIEGELAPPVDEPTPMVEINASLERNPKSSQCIVTEFDDSSSAIEITPIPRRNARGGSKKVISGTTGQLYATKRDRRRAEKNDPLAKSRREALKVWTADQTRRRSSAGDWPPSHSQVEAGLSLKDWVARRRNSAEAIADQLEGGGGLSRQKEEEPWKASTAGDLRTSASPESRHRRPSPLTKKSSDRTVSQWRASHPGRADRGRLEKHGRPTSYGIDSWEGDAGTNPPTPRTPGSTVVGRASAWARSPGRETAGGILVKHCFFYGPAGKIAIGRSPNTTPSFESQWMRKFREEVQGNPNWWAGPGQYHPGRSADLPFQSVLCRTSATKRRLAYPMRTADSISSEKDGVARNTNLWDEVRSLLARSKRGGGATNLSGSGGGNKGAEDKGEAIPEGVDALSFGDRLRCTPLSQGAWLIDSAGDEQSSSVASYRGSDGAAMSVAERARGGSIKAPGGVKTSSDRVQDHSQVVVAGRAAVDISHISDNPHPGGRKGSFLEGESSSGTGSDDISNGGGRRKSLQSVHEAILAKLRGEIDPFTREEIVLQAAEDAKGALARDQAHASSPRRPSAGVQHRPSSSGTADSVPAPIDYDKVEATLSLIELASRAAGPDAGKQMLQALEGLDKIHQRVSDDEMAGEKKECASDDKADLQAGSVRGNGGDRGLTMPETSGDGPARDDLPRDELSRDQLTLTLRKNPYSRDESPVEIGGEEKAPHQPSRRISLAVSEMSDDNNMGSLSTGVMQSIGNWLRRVDRPSQQQSFASTTADMGGDNQQQERGREGFPFPSPLSTAPQERVAEGVKAENAGEIRSYEGKSKEGGPKVGESQREESKEWESKEEGGEEEVSPTGRVSVTAQQNGKDDRTSYDATSKKNVDRTSSDATPNREVDPTSVNETLSREDDHTSFDATPKKEANRPNAGVQDTDGDTFGPDHASLAQEIGDHAWVADTDTVPTPLAAEPDARIQEIPIDTGNYSQADTAISNESPPLQRKAVENDKSKSPRSRHSSVQKNMKMQFYQIKSHKTWGERTNGAYTEKLPATKANTTGTRETLAGGQSLGPSVNGAGDRDSWMSVGTRPKRGVDGQEHRPGREGARSDAGMKLFGDGRPRAKYTAVIGTRTLAADLEKSLTRGVPSKVCAKFVWPRPGRSTSEKRVNLAPSGKTPGIVRRSPLIDAFHPEVARQRAFRLTLRKAGQPNAPPPMSPKEKQSMDAFPPLTTEEEPSVNASDQTTIRKHQGIAEACSPANEGIAGKASTRRRQRRPLTGQQNPPPPPTKTQDKQNSIACAEIRTKKLRDTAAAEASSPAVSSSIAEKASTRRRERKPLSVVPPSSPPPPPSPAMKDFHPLPLPSQPQPVVGDNSESRNETAPAMEATSADRTVSAEDAVVPAAGLTFVQCECAEKWMARAKCSLGPKVRECLGSTPAFYRVRDHFRRSLGLAGGCKTSNKSSRPLEFSPPVRTGERGRESKERLAVTSKGLDGGGILRPTSRKDERRSGARDEERVIFGPNSLKRGGWKLETEHKAENVPVWVDRLSQKAALVIDAVMWTIATERERSTVSAAILQGRNKRNERPNVSALRAWLSGGDISREGDGDSKPMETLAVSWPRARRFAKSSSLVDGIKVVEADIDLAFKRWEESARTGRPALATTTNLRCSPGRSGSEPPARGSRTEENASRVRSRDGGGIPRMCDAVGCSEGGRYGDICPTVKWRFCRKHRSDGMLDLGGQRCERAGCARFAVRSNSLGSARKNTLCSLHTQEDRVGLEGLAFVLLALAEARRRGPRRLAAMTGRTQINVSPEEEDADSAVSNAPAVRDVILALTNQLLPPALPATARTPSPGIETHGGFGARGDTVRPTWNIQLRPTSDTQSTKPGAATRSAGEAQVVTPAVETLLKPNGSRRLGGLRRTSDQAKERKELPDSGAPGAAECLSLQVPVSSSPSPSRYDPLPSPAVCSGSKSLPVVQNEPSLGGSSVEKCQQSRQLHQANEHGEERPESEDHGGGYGEGRGGECLEHKARGRRIRNSLAGCNDDESRELGAENLNASRVAHDDCANRPSSTDTAWGGIRWRGVDEVLGRNARPLKAVFRRYSRYSGGAREMALPDVLRFCDAFELRPGLVSRREIVDGFKEVVFPGVMGLTDEDIGYSLKIDQRRPSQKPARSGLPRQADFPRTGFWGVSPQNREHQGGETIASGGPATAAVANFYGARAGGDEHCRALFSSDTGGDNHPSHPSHLRAPDRPVSTSSGGGGGVRRNKKAAYLGRSQKFPLRRVVSTAVASSDEDVSSNSSAGGGFRKRASFRGSPLSRTGSLSQKKGVKPACGDQEGEREAKDPPVAPGLSLPQFFEWLSEVVVKCHVSVKSFGHGFAGQPDEKRFGRWGNGRSGSLLESTSKGREGRQSTGKGTGEIESGGKSRGVGVMRRHNAAKALVMLQWMELSRGMRSGGIPPFDLSSCFPDAASRSVGCSGRR